MIKNNKYILSLMIALCFTILGGCNTSSRVPSDKNPALSTLAPSPNAFPTAVPAIEATPGSPAPTASTPAVVAIPVISKASEVLYDSGYEQYNNFNYDEAIKLFDRAIETDNNNYKAYSVKGIALCFKGRYVEGMSMIDKALAINSTFAYGCFNKAMAYKLQKDYDSSLLWFDNALKLDPKDIWSYYGISTIYADKGDLTRSLEYLKKAIDLDPSVKEVARQQDHFVPYRNNEEFKKIVK